MRCQIKKSAQKSNYILTILILDIMKILLIKSILPVAAFMLASAGAVNNSSSTTESATASEPGFRRIAPFNCQLVKMCNNVGDILCNDGGGILYGKITPTSDCTKILTHRE